MGMIMKNGVPYAQGSEIPQGGTKGQVLAKASDLDGDMVWKDEEGGGGGGDAYTKAETDALLDEKQNKLVGGLKGQVPVKMSVADGDMEWQDVDVAFGNDKKYVIGDYIDAITNFTNGVSNTGVALHPYESRLFKISHTVGGTAQETVCYVDERHSQASTLPYLYVFNDLDTRGRTYSTQVSFNLVPRANPNPPPNVIQGPQWECLDDTSITKIEVYNAETSELIRTLPKGGTTGQALVKVSDIDGDAEWKDVGGGGGETPTLDAVLKKGNDTDRSARFTDELNGVQAEIYANGTYMTGNGTEGMRQFSVSQNGIRAVDNLVGTITPKFVVPFEPSGEDQVAMSDAVKASFKKALGIANDAFVFDVDSDQFTPDPDNPDGKHYGMTITSPTYDELLAMLQTDTFVYVRLLYNSGKAYEIMQLFHNMNSIYGRYFDVEFPQKRLQFASAYVNKRTNNETYFGTYQDYIDGTVDTYTKAETDDLLDAKQDTLESGTNIKTVAGESLLGSGDIPIPTYAGSGWGVAKNGTATLTFDQSTTSSVVVSIADLGLADANYYVAVSGNLVGLWVNSKTSSNFRINGTLASQSSVSRSVEYTVFAKGYGGVPNGGTTGQVLAKKSNADGDTEWVTGGGGGGQDNVIESISVNGISQTVDANKNVDLLVPTYSKNTAAFAAYDEGAEFNLQASTNGMTASWAEGTTVVSSELTSKTYVDGVVGDLTTLTTTDKSSAVAAINEIDSALKGLGEPFRIKNWASGSLNVAIPYCTEDLDNTAIAKMDFNLDDVEGADYQVVGMIAYEVFGADGKRINCWPVCQFTGNGQKTLTVRWACMGSARKTATKLNAWVLLKHR